MKIVMRINKRKENKIVEALVLIQDLVQILGQVLVPVLQKEKWSRKDIIQKEEEHHQKIDTITEQNIKVNLNIIKKI